MMDIWTALIAGIAAFFGSWLAPFSKDRALAQEESRAHKRKLLSDAREAIQWFSGHDPRTSFINDAKYLAIRPYLATDLIAEIETPFLPGTTIQVYVNREWGSPSLDKFRSAVDELEKKWFEK
jgi:hypothetical protein